MPRGRRPKAPEDRKVHINVRLEPDLLERLNRMKGKLTLSEEIDRRLRLSFTDIRIEDPRGYQTRAFCRLLVQTLQNLKRDTGHPWFRNPFTFGHALIAAAELFRYFQPRGRRSVPDDLPLAELQKSRGLDPEPILKQAKTYPFGKVAARMAVFHLEFAEQQSGDVDDIEDDLKRERELFKDLSIKLRGRLTSSAQADLLNWSDK